MSSKSWAASLKSKSLVPRKFLQTFSIVFLLSDWLKSNHLVSPIEHGFFDIFRAIFVAL